ncbi:hypothetical protein N0V82_002892 [Gnomoniopsis sp. IMI 355080]|nr:hypothetical protein N0V82_002892 [Gnomoniopsis sp. IMI 355080]
MERDARRDRGQWRGCHSFKGIVCDGDRPGTSSRNGGLKMGQPYYFYYELDGTHETHDTSLPSTSACPYLPGQTVNVMVVPDEQSDRKRSASLGSIHYDDFMTMDPGDKFSAPRRAPPPPAIPDFLGPRYRLPTAHTPSLRRRRSDRSLSPGNPNSWWSPRKLFTRKHSTSSVQSDGASVSEAYSSEEQRSSLVSSSSQSATSRSMSPESLRRFLCDETPVATDAESTNQLALFIPDDIAEEEDDDEFVVASAASEYGPKTILSPPPMSRHKSCNTLRRLPDNESVINLQAVQQGGPEFTRPRYPLPSTTFYYKPAAKQEHGEDETPTSRFSFSSDEGSVYDDDEVDPLSPAGVNEIPSFSQSDVEEDDNDLDCLSPPINFGSKRAGINMGRESMEQSLAKAFEGYRLPRSSMDGNNKLPSSGTQHSEASFVNSPPLLALPIMDDFASDLKSAGLF